MPEWRKLHVKSLDSHDIQAMPDDFTRFMWLVMPLGLDREGRGVDDPAWIRSKLFPLRRDVTLEQVEAAMEVYSGLGEIERYQVGGRRYFRAVNFHVYQGKTDREAASKIPGPESSPTPAVVKTSKGLAKVKSNARPLPEPVRERSMTDSDSDSDSDSIKQVGAEPAPTPAPDRVEALSKVFEKASGITRPLPVGKKAQAMVGVTWWNPLRQMVTQANGSAETIMGLAVKQMRAEKLTIASPASVEKVFVSIYGERNAKADGGRPGMSADELAAARTALRAAGHTGRVN